MTTVAEYQGTITRLLEPLAARLAPANTEGAVTGPDAAVADLALSPRRRVLAADVLAPIDLPPFDNSQMDGYAVRSVDVANARVEHPATIGVGQTIAAGDSIGHMTSGSTRPIMTGAPVPIGADAIVPVEQVDPPRFGAAESVRFCAPVAPGTFVRARGSDLAAGAVLLPAGTLLGSAQLGVLAGSGVTHVSVRRALRVLLLSTGHELQEPGTDLASGHIYDANTTLLVASLTDCGAEVIAVRANDDADQVLATIREHGESVDMVLTSGGVSAGAFEVVREALEPHGVRFCSVAVQPGGPQGSGRIRLAAHDAHPHVELPAVCFPGNPVSTLVSFELFLRPVLRRIAGLTDARPTEQRPLAHAVTSIAAKHQVRRGAIDDAGMVELIGGASSHLLHAYARSRVLVHLPVGLAHAEPGDLVTVWRIDG